MRSAFLGEELLVDRGDRLVGVSLVDDNGDLDLGGGDHADVDLSVIQCLKHLGGYAGVALHTSADDRYLGDVIIIVYALRADAVGEFLRDLLRLGTLVLRYGEGKYLLRQAWGIG